MKEGEGKHRSGRWVGKVRSGGGLAEVRRLTWRGKRGLRISTAGSHHQVDAGGSPRKPNDINNCSNWTY